MLLLILKINGTYQNGAHTLIANITNPIYEPQVAVTTNGHSLSISLERQVSHRKA